MNTSLSKRSYHPLVLYFYFNNQLNKEQLKQIPKTTIHYWQNLDKDELFGNEWFTLFNKEQADFLKIQQYKYTFKCLRIMLKTLKCFCVIQEQCADFKKIMQKNYSIIVSTIDYLKSTVSLSNACNLFSISEQQYYVWKNKKYCKISPFHFCLKKHPFQLTVKEFYIIKKAFDDLPYTFLPKVSVYYDLLNRNLIHCSLSSFYKYASLVIESNSQKVKHNLSKLTLYSERPFEYLHIDTTFINTIKDGFQRVVFVKDNFSKTILHFAIVSNGKSEFVADVLKQTFDKYGLTNFTKAINIVSDKGTENKGEVLNWINELAKSHLVFKKTVGENGFMYTNNEVESSFSIFKNQFAKNRIFITQSDLFKVLEEFLYYNNEIRYPKNLYGLHPFEVLNGEPINKYKFHSQKQIAIQLRYQTNKSMNDCNKCK